MSITVYTDGCCLRNPGGAGGWAFVVDGSSATTSGGEPTTTNNRMELIAIREALRFARDVEGEVTVCSDSQYCVRGVNEWMETWKAAGWKKKRGRIKNLDLWKELDALFDPDRMHLEWVRGHDGNPLNERADEIAGQAAVYQAATLTA